MVQGREFQEAVFKRFVQKNRNTNGYQQFPERPATSKNFSPNEYH